MEERLERITTAIRSALHEGQTKWSLQFLTAKDPRFVQAWDVAQQIPGWFEEINAVSQFLVIAELRPQRIVEIGSYLGRSTVFFAKTLEVLGIDGTVTAIDPHTGDRQHLENLGISELPSFEMFRSHLEATGLQDRVQAIVASSHDAVADWTDPIDYLFIDGWHSYEAVVQDGHDWVPRLTIGVSCSSMTRHAFPMCAAESTNWSPTAPSASTVMLLARHSPGVAPTSLPRSAPFSVRFGH